MSSPAARTAGRRVRAVTMRSSEIAPHVVCLGLAPAIDRLCHVSEPRLGQVNQATKVVETFGGSAARIVTTLTLAGTRARLVVPWGGSRLMLPSDATVVELLTSPRVNTVIMSQDGSTTNVAETPHPLSSAEWEVLQAMTLAALPDAGGVLVVAGDVPVQEGAGEQLPVASLLRAVTRKHTQVCLGVPGHTLRTVLQDAPPVAMVTLNRRDLSHFFDARFTTLGDVLDAAHVIRATHRVGVVLISLDGDGLLAVGDTVVWARAQAPRGADIEGAAAAVVAGFISAHTRAPEGSTRTLTPSEDAVHTAASWAALAAQSFTYTAHPHSVLPWATTRRVSRSHVLEDSSPVTHTPALAG